MLNERKIKLMTRIAIREKKQGNEIDIARKSFKVDYITLNMLITAVTTTIGYILIVIMYVLGHLEELLVNSAEMDFPKLISNALSYYGIMLVIFLAIAFFFYSYRYDKSSESLKKTYSDYKNLSKLMEK